jgi:hypothetical protein
LVPAQAGAIVAPESNGPLDLTGEGMFNVDGG